MGTLIDQLVNERLGKLKIERIMMETINDLLFSKEHLDLTPDLNAGFTAGSDDAVKFVAFLKEKGIPLTMERRFNNHLGKLYHEFRCAIPAFMECAKRFALKYDHTKAIALYPEQLLLILAVVRFKLRRPMAGKVRLARSGDGHATTRQAYMVQRWINLKGTKMGHFIVIGNICTVNWQEISNAELEANELGDDDTEAEEDDEELDN
ncbi:unnamed protein product [Closterium sp. Yama58-4]|nr:unnamed protein product [Closterium sp. Yama58-4]